MVTIRPTQNPGFSHHPGASTETQFCILELMNSHFRSNILSILFLSIATLFISCEDQGGSRDSLGNYYFDSITALDLESSNDCSLPPCSNERINRYHFYEVEGVFWGNSISIYINHFESFHLILCEPEKFNLPAISSVIFTGTGSDACGYIEMESEHTIHNLFLEIASIELIKY